MTHKRKLGVYIFRTKSSDIAFCCKNVKQPPLCYCLCIKFKKINTVASKGENVHLNNYFMFFKLEKYKSRFHPLLWDFVKRCKLKI